MTDGWIDGWMNRQMNRWTYLQDRRSEVPNGSLPLQIYGVNHRKLGTQAPFNP